MQHNVTLCLRYAYYGRETYWNAVMRARSVRRDKCEIARPITCRDSVIRAVPWLRRFVADFSPPRTGCDPRPAQMMCGGQRSIGTGFPPLLPFLISVSFQRCSMLIYKLFLPGRQNGEAWEPSKKQCSFGNRGALDSRVLSLFVVSKR
jgi:hypothetical protein